MINTESFRAWKDTVEYAGLRDGEKQKLQKDIDIVADELDRLYLDHAPLTREELEGVLKEAGFVKDESNGVFTRNHEFYLQKDYEEWFELSIKGVRIIATYASGAVTRATLRNCGVIK